MRILGIDPGLRHTGYGVIDKSPGLQLVEAGVVRTNAKDAIGLRLSAIYNGIIDLIHEVRPQVLVLEKLFAHHRHPTTALLMGHARGVICLAASLEQIPMVNLPSTRVKKAVISDGHASKEKIQRAVQGYLDLKQAPSPFDVSDALAIALAYALTEKNGALQSSVVMDRV